jgi:hypothetical protein
MLDDKCVPEPLSIDLNMFVYPFFSPKSQRTEPVQRPDVVDENVRRDWFLLWCVQGVLLLRFCRRICLEATTVEIETLTPRLVSTVAWFLSERLDGLLLMLSEFY